MSDDGLSRGGGTRLGRRAGLSMAAVVVVAASSVAACSGGSGGAAKGTTTTNRPPTSQAATNEPPGQGDGSRPAFCQGSPELRQGFSGDAKDPQAVTAALDAYIAWINRAMEGAPEPVRRDLSYLVSRYQQFKAAVVGGESPAAAAGQLDDQREAIAAAAATFATYTRERCQGAPGDRGA